ncbi:MAG: DUF3558 domain-containing protein [Gordonia sp. (in: high G+C Gram-positive bacteria)]|uniref:DUF3558 domain-containing protein n=1 Tax=Gordonia sp. (in: high G+C Gram-positive bacteria) TaxID=84139 RepID=UPI0039E55C14
MVRGRRSFGGAFVIIIGICLLGACGAVVDGNPSGVTSDRGQASRSLPFVPTIEDRWNSRNMGTEYEPCNALTSREISGLGVDPDTVRDAARTSGQTARGCAWKYRRESFDDESRWSITQAVGNSKSLEAYKIKYSSWPWRRDVSIEGRPVGVRESTDVDECMTYVQSGTAGVHTLVIHLGDERRPIDEACGRAIEFTRATVSRMPR